MIIPKHTLACVNSSGVLRPGENRIRLCCWPPGIKELSMSNVESELVTLDSLTSEVILASVSSKRKQHSSIFTSNSIDFLNTEGLQSRNKVQR